MPNNTIADNLQRLITAKTDIKNAIIQMGGGVEESHGLEEFANDILTIPSGSVVTEWPVVLCDTDTSFDINETFSYYSGGKTYSNTYNVGSGTLTPNSITFSFSATKYSSASYSSPSYSYKSSLDVSAYVQDFLGITGKHILNSQMASYFSTITGSTNKPVLSLEFDVYCPADGIQLYGSYGTSASFSCSVFGRSIFSESGPYNNTTAIQQHYAFDVGINSNIVSVCGSRSYRTYSVYAKVSNFQISNIRAKIYLPSSSE